jgi:hypothetical protein
MSSMSTKRILTAKWGSGAPKEQFDGRRQQLDGGPMLAIKSRLDHLSDLVRAAQNHVVRLVFLHSISNKGCQPRDEKLNLTSAANTDASQTW